MPRQAMKSTTDRRMVRTCGLPRIDAKQPLAYRCHCCSCCTKMHPTYHTYSSARCTSRASPNCVTPLGRPTRVFRCPCWMFGPFPWHASVYLPCRYRTPFAHGMAMNCIIIGCHLVRITQHTGCVHADWCSPTLACVACWCRCFHNEEV